MSISNFTTQFHNVFNTIFGIYWVKILFQQTVKQQSLNGRNNNAFGGESFPTAVVFVKYNRPVVEGAHCLLSILQGEGRDGDLFPGGVLLAPVAGGFGLLSWSFPVSDLGVTASGDSSGLLWPVTVEWDDGSVGNVVLGLAANLFSSLSLLEFLLLDFLGSSVEEKIGHDLSLPLGGSVEGTSESEDLSDESTYICEYTTFPAGNRENTVNLTVYGKTAV